MPCRGALALVLVLALMLALALKCPRAPSTKSLINRANGKQPARMFYPLLLLWATLAHSRSAHLGPSSTDGQQASSTPTNHAHAHSAPQAKTALSNMPRGSDAHVLRRRRAAGWCANNEFGHFDHNLTGWKGRAWDLPDAPHYRLGDQIEGVTVNECAESCIQNFPTCTAFHFKPGKDLCELSRINSKTSFTPHPRWVIYDRTSVCNTPTAAPGANSSDSNDSSDSLVAQLNDDTECPELSTAHFMAAPHARLADYQSGAYEFVADTKSVGTSPCADTCLDAGSTCKGFVFNHTTGVCQHFMLSMAPMDMAVRQTPSQRLVVVLHAYVLCTTPTLNHSLYTCPSPSCQTLFHHR